MKKIFLFLIALSFSFFLTLNVNAQDIKNISMDINIDENGTAHITEYWTIFFEENEDLTEVYKPYYNYENSSFENFKVSLNGKNYTFTNNWNINESFEWKSYKNGFHKIDDGIELCFGISEKGKENTYKMSYDITNFVYRVEDADMVYWTLIPHNLNDEPENVDIKIYSNFKYDDELPVWGYGNYGGYAYVSDGVIFLKSNGTLQSDEYMTVLVKFPLGTFNIDENVLDEDFDYYYDLAEQGATDYNESDFSFNQIFPIIIFLAIVISSFITVKRKINITGSYKIKFKKGTNRIPKEIHYIRDIPCNKDLYKAYWISKTYKINKKDTDFLGAILLKWINENKIEIEKEIKNGVFKKEKSKLILKNDLTFDYNFEKELYSMLYEASIDGVLEAAEFKYWASENYTEIYNWYEKVLDFITESLAKENKLTKLSSTKYETTESIYKDAIELKGLKKYLLDFSRIYEKEPLEVHLWKEYLVFAQMFGIAEKVAKDFKDIYPDVVEEEYLNDFSFIYFVSYSGMNSASSAKTKAESYDSGGGGFSSGGGGFGSFGGGGFGGGGGR